MIYAVSEIVWKCTLDTYAQIVERKKAKKIDYNIWRKLISCKDIALRFFGEYFVDIRSRDVIIACFNTTLDDFGRFLDKQFNNKKEKVTLYDTALNIKVDANGNTYYDTGATTSTNIDWNKYTTNSTTNTTAIKEEKKEMRIPGFDFGPCDSNVHMSMYGLAIKNQSGEWVSYDKAKEEIVNVDVFNFAEGSKLFWKMPVALSAVKTGDMLIHNKRPCYVTGFAEDSGNPVVIDVWDMTRKEILLPTNMFGFNYATKVVSLMDGFVSVEAPTADNPFGNMLPLLMMQDDKMDDILPFFLMQSGKRENGFNPMLMYFMMKNKGGDNLLPFMFMMNQK